MAGLANVQLNATPHAETTASKDVGGATRSAGDQAGFWRAFQLHDRLTLVVNGIDLRQPITSFEKPKLEALPR